MSFILNLKWRQAELDRVLHELEHERDRNARKRNAGPLDRTDGGFRNGVDCDRLCSVWRLGIDNDCQQKWVDESTFGIGVPMGRADLLDDMTSRLPALTLLLDELVSLYPELNQFQPDLALPCPRPAHCARCARAQRPELAAHARAARNNQTTTRREEPRRQKIAPASAYVESWHQPASCHPPCV